MPAVLVTGAARGIGLAIAERLLAAGWEVHAGVRDARDAPVGTTPVVLDVTNAEQVAALDGALPARLDAVVNNAGIVVHGPLETTPIDVVRSQLEVNAIGAVAVTQALLPRLRASKGRAVFVSSVNGRISTPMTSAYNASKFAVEAFADALRVEVRPWGVRVVLVEPAQTDTNMWHQMDADFAAAHDALPSEQRDLYAKHFAGMRKRIPLSLKLVVPPDDVAATVECALTTRRPRARYVVGAGPRAQAVLAGVTPTPVLDAVLRLATGVPRRP